MIDVVWKKKEKSALVEAVLALKNKDEAQRFLRDLLTQDEIQEISKRFLAATMLTVGSSYREVERATGFSSTTVARVSKWLQGSLGGYRLIIERLGPSNTTKSSHHYNHALVRRGML